MDYRLNSIGGCKCHPKHELSLFIPWGSEVIYNPIGDAIGNKEGDGNGGGKWDVRQVSAWV